MIDICRSRQPRASALIVAAAAIAGLTTACGDRKLTAGGSSDGGDAPDDAAAPVDLAIDTPVATDAGIDLVTSDGSGIGTGCSALVTGNQLTQGTCAKEQLCLVPADGAPGGYCTAACDVGTCPGDSTCVPTGGGSMFCLANCAAAGDCRDGYQCQSAGRGVKVCTPAGSDGETPAPIGAKPDGTACVAPEVKAPGTGARTFGANVGPISLHAGSVIEAEDFIAVYHDDVVVGFNDLSSYKIGFSTSNDNGGTFTFKGNAPGPTRAQSDPVVVADNAGVFYMSWVGFDVDSTGMKISNMRVFVAKSSDHGATFTTAVPASDPADYVDGQRLLDKPWISISPVDGTVYVSYMVASYADGSTTIKMTRSRDKAASFETPSITLNGNRAAGRNLAQHVVDIAGNVHAVWFEGDTDKEMFGGPNNAVYYTRWPAGAVTVIRDLKVTGTGDSVTYEDPSIAVFGARVFVGYISGTPKGDWDVKVAASLDGGANFGAGVTVNDDGTPCATHFHHQIAVDDAGRVHAVWFDNRYKTGNVMYARSADNGATWSPNEFVNDQGFEFATARDQTNWLGDYLGLTVSGKTIYCAWTDSRRQNASHIYFAKGTLP